MRRFRIIVLALVSSAFAQESNPYLWQPTPGEDCIAMRWEPPTGFRRVSAPEGSFAEWLRGLPLLPGRPPVLLYNGSPKKNQEAHAAVVDIDVGTEDLQQCADAVMRLRAEYLFATHQQDKIVFGLPVMVPWSTWKDGQRPAVQNDKMVWHECVRPDSSYRCFQRYLDMVYRHLGTRTLERDLVPVKDPSHIEPGDVFIHGGSPGHAVIVVDVAEDSTGARVFLLAQSYMPAQQIQILRSLNPRSPWYEARSSGILETPEWEFAYFEAKRFP